MFIIWLRPSIDKPDSLRDLVIFIISLISSFELMNVVLPDPNGIKALLTIGLRTFPTKGEPLFGNGSRSMPKKFSQFSYFI